MQRRQFVTYVLERGVVVALGGAACSASGCGAIMHPERCGQPHSNQIDWKIAALDGLGLLLFFVPGVVAFAVDFCTGAIFLPMCEAYPCYGAGGPLPPGSVVVPPGSVVVPPQYPAMAAPLPAPPPEPTPAAASAAPALRQPSGHELGLRRLAIPREQLQQERIERIVAQHVGRPVSLDDRHARVSALAQIERFEEQADRHRTDSDFGTSVRSFFERLLPA